MFLKMLHKCTNILQHVDHSSLKLTLHLLVGVITVQRFCERPLKNEEAAFALNASNLEALLSYVSKNVSKIITKSGNVKNIYVI